ncbi:RagB/SusD family nutrient uptake outer membrane protein [Olivibacter jilunii]|uniref:RagB/SusD family nutrient uptake outer membrane protein n=1 Tax=Olivibacter jilunii TaxID=985016 RepID=UPI0029B8122E|nr:RagB/SusD family nutrient uptake outer membrane protein [Olivibacter sp. UJ_SKK_5.1]MDX3917107.1 RagB/SusD family nutrient uptake outer membrane protein [Pseudosphingobacterium sp.]
MKRNTKNYIIAALSLSLLATGCSKDFLERPPLNQVSQETFWKKENDVYQAVNGVYNKLTGDGVIYDDGASDNAHAQYPWESFATELSSGNVTTALTGSWNFEDIRRCNYFLENADKAAEVMDATLLERYKAEVRFLRAYFYTLLMNKYGDVPIITKTLSLDEVNIPRNPHAEVVKFVTDELQAIKDILPVSYSGGKSNEKGRATKGAVLSLLSRVQLNEGQWQAAAEAAEQVMGLGYSLFKLTTEAPIDATDDYSEWVNFRDAADEQKFRLALRSYEGLFRQVNEGNSEVIFDRQYIAQVDANYLNTYLPSGDMGGWSSVTPTQSLVDAYDNYQSGEPISPVDPARRAEWYKNNDPAFANEYKNRDPRFYATVLFNGAPWNAFSNGFEFKWTPGASNMSQTGYNFRKLVDPTFYQEPIIDNHANVILIRYAEILLTYAEAKNELSGPDAAIYTALNQIRERAGMPPVDQAKYASQESLRQLIRRERRVELALEGQRFMDIRRWKIAPQVMKNINDVRNTLAQARSWNDKLYLLPVPQTQIDLSQGVLTQNPGY